MVIGYRADDSYFQYAEAFVFNGLSLSSLNKALRLGRLSNAKVCLAAFFDYAINDCMMKPEWEASLSLVTTGYAEQFERGNPAYVEDLLENPMA